MRQKHGQRYGQRYIYNLFLLLTAAVDAAILYGCAELAVYIRLRLDGASITERNLSDITGILPLICLIGIILLYNQGLYGQPDQSAFDVVYAVLLSVFMISVITMALSFFFRSFAYPRTVVMLGAVAQAVFLSVWRAAALYIGKAVYGKHALLVVGHEPDIHETARKITGANARIYYIKQLFDPRRDNGLSRQIKEADYVFICPNMSESERQHIFTYCMMYGTGVFMAPDLFEISIKNARVHTFGDTLAFRVSGLTLTREQQAVKRVFDIVFSLTVLTVTLPLTLLFALIIRLTSPGPVIYKQERVTKDNRRFNLYKLRTMERDAEDKTGPVIASVRDGRVTRFGAFLRSIRLDELPQFINVLFGEMSVVGPRPEREYFINQFKREYPDYDYRATVKAGITGYAQLMGKYATNAADKLRFDLWYIKNYSLWLDITLIVKTVKVLFMKGSAGETDGAEINKTIQDINIENLRQGKQQKQRRNKNVELALKQ